MNNASERFSGRALRWIKTNKAVAIVLAVCLFLGLVAISIVAYLIITIQNNVRSDSRDDTTSEITAPSVATDEPSHPGLDDTLAVMNKDIAPYGVRVTLSPEKDAYSTWAELSAEDSENLKTFATYLTTQFKKYPKDLVKNSELEKIALVKGLIVSGGARAATPSPGTDSMIYDINAMNANGADYAQQVISHEYWHYIDFTLKGLYDYEDAKWTACNPQGFNYGSGGASAYGDPNYQATFHPSNGFITQYSQYAIEEDRADMFGWLIYKPSAVKDLNDPGLSCKTDRLKAIVNELSPGMNF